MELDRTGDAAADIMPGREHLCGAFTKTVIHSPVVRWILHAQIRHEDLDDVILVGDDFVHVKQLESQGYLRHIATKKNFDAKIRAAATICVSLESLDDFPIKLEPDQDMDEKMTVLEQPAMPPQLIVLTLDCDELMFLCLRPNEDGTYSFVQTTRPMPSFDQMIFKLGEHLCVSPSSRAIAVGAMERELLLCSTRDPQHVKADFVSLHGDWCPVSSQRSFHIDGIIQNVAFLSPSAGSENHIILLLIIVDANRTKAMWIDWYHPADVQNAQMHNGQALDDKVQASSLLIPLMDASFFLIKEYEIIYWTNLLSGSAVSYSVTVHPVSTRHPGSSSRQALWASWTKPSRIHSYRKNMIDIYLAREDGMVFLLNADDIDMLGASHAGDLDCQVGSAFASVGSEYGADILAVAGDMSSGRIVTIGPLEFDEASILNRQQAMAMRTAQWLPNWASTMDICPTDLGISSSARSRHSHGFYATAGCEPHGSIMELRTGFEASLLAYFDLDDLSSVTDVWIIPYPHYSGTVLVMSRPTSTQLLQLSTDITEVGALAEPHTFNTVQRTLAACLTSSQRLVQVCPSAIYISDAFNAKSEEGTHVFLPETTTIVSATLLPEQDTILYAESGPNGSQISRCSSGFSPEGELNKHRPPEHVVVLSLQSAPLCIDAIAVGSDIVIAAATGDNKLILMLLTGHSAPVHHFEGLPATSSDQVSVCDHIALLQSPVEPGSLSNLLVVCGLRDGRIISYHINFELSQPFNNAHSTNFSASTVKLVTLNARTGSAVAMSETDFCLLNWTGKEPYLSSIESIWASDRSRPELPQKPVVACRAMPPAEHFNDPAMSQSLLLISEDSISVGILNSTVSTVPRRILVAGTPRLVTYAEDLRSIVCSSECSGIKSVASSRPHTAPNAERQRWPVIDFIPIRDSSPSYTLVMQPGERVKAIMPWSYRNNEDKKYTYLLVAGSYVRRNGFRRGRISLLQPHSRNRAVIGMHNEPYILKFDDEVFAVCQYDAVTFIACSGSSVCLYRFSADAKRWNQLCTPFRLTSPGTCVSSQKDSRGRRLITLSTARDSIAVLTLHEIALETGAEFQHRLVQVSNGPNAEISQSHLVFANDCFAQYNQTLQDLTLLSTKDCRLIGLVHPDFPTDTNIDAYTSSLPAEVQFEARLTGSLVRLRKCMPFERKGVPPHGIIDCRIAGCRTDGTIVGVALLQPNVWRRLFWLQRLCEWSEDLSPHSHRMSPYGTESFAGTGRALPIGLTDNKSMVMLHTELTRAEDYHIDGDTVARVLEPGGPQSIRQKVSQLAENDDSVGLWLREHLVEELRAVEEVVEQVETLIKWM